MKRLAPGARLIAWVIPRRARWMWNQFEICWSAPSEVHHADCRKLPVIECRCQDMPFHLRLNHRAFFSTTILSVPAPRVIGFSVELKIGAFAVF